MDRQFRYEVSEMETEMNRDPKLRSDLEQVLKDMHSLPQNGLPKGEALYNLLKNQFTTMHTDYGRLVLSLAAAVDLILYVQKFDVLAPMGILVANVCATLPWLINQLLTPMLNVNYPVHSFVPRKNMDGTSVAARIHYRALSDWLVSCYSKPRGARSVNHWFGASLQAGSQENINYSLAFAPRRYLGFCSAVCFCGALVYRQAFDERYFGLF